MNSKMNSFSLNIPYYHFIYEGDFYNYLRIKNNKLLANGMRINQYFFKETYTQYKNSELDLKFEKALMILIHSFPDNQPRDLDNIQYKPVIDAIRKTKIINDDSWQNLSLMYLGSLSEKEKIDVYLVPHTHVRNFLSSELNSYFS